MEAASALAEASGGATLHFEGPAWNGRTVDLIRLAKAHAYLILHSNFVSHIAALKQKARSLTLHERDGRLASRCNFMSFPWNHGF